MKLHFSKVLHRKIQNLERNFYYLKNYFYSPLPQEIHRNKKNVAVKIRQGL